MDHSYINDLCSRGSEALQSSQPVSVTNRFSLLTKLPDPTTRYEATSSESRKTIDIYNYKRKQNQKRQSVRNNVNNHHRRNSVQHWTDYQIPRSEPMKQDNSERKPNLTFETYHNNPRMSANTDISVSGRVKHDDHDTTQHIPFIVNGEVIETKNSKVELFNTGDKRNTQNTISELIMELTNTGNSCSVNKKHNIICTGDSHIRGFTNVVKTL
jgi:hypothetical protein